VPGESRLPRRVGLGPGTTGEQTTDQGFDSLILIQNLLALQRLKINQDMKSDMNLIEELHIFESALFSLQQHCLHHC